MSKVEVAEKVSVTAGPDGTKVVEEFAKKALSSKDFGYETFEQLAELVRVQLKASATKSRLLMSHDKTIYLLGIRSLGSWWMLWGYKTYPEASLAVQVRQ